MTRKLAIAVVGAGLIGRRHIEHITRSDETSLAAVVDPTPQAAIVAQHHGVPHFADLAAALSSMQADGIIIATPNHLHVEQGLMCVAKGLPTLVEKPLAHQLDAGRRLVEAAEQAGVKLLTGQHRRHGPKLAAAVAAIRSGLLGKIVAVQGSSTYYKPESAGYFDGANAWRREPGGGPILINMIHEVDSLRAMVGEITAVQAIASNQTRGFPVEDTAAMVLRFDNGALGSFLISDTAASARNWEHTSGENPDYPNYTDEDSYVIMGTDGSLAVPTMRLKRYGRVEDRNWWKPFITETLPVTSADPLARQIAQFAAVIRGEAEPLVSGRDGLRNLEVVDAIIRATQTQALITL